MGFIYKITNKRNNHSYIGQTNISIEQRWRDHCRVSFNPNSDEYEFPLHRAIRKYGKENFNIELLEECDNLNDREIFWIAKLNTYEDGYNAARGGSGHQKYNYDDIVNYYLSHNFSLTDTCKYFQIYDQVVYSALKSKNIDYKTLSETKNHGKKIIGKYYLLIEEKLIFKSMKEINIYFNKTAHPNIRRCLNGITKKAYGYTWKEIEESDIDGYLDDFRFAFKS